MVSIGDKALLFRNRNMMWLEESRSPSIGDKGFLVRTKDANYFLRETSVSVGSKGRLFNINNQYYLRSRVKLVGTLRWMRNLSGEIHGINVASDGIIFVGLSYPEYGVRALFTDGTIKWSNSTGGYYSGIGISSGETLIFSADDGGFIRAFDIEDGTQQWAWKDTSPLFYVADYWSAVPVDENDNVYASGRFALASVDIYGNMRFVNQSVGESDSDIKVDGTQVYSMSDRFYALDINSGDINWSSGEGGIGGGIAVQNNKVWFAGYDTVSNFDLNGNLNWSYALEGGAFSAIAVDEADNIYFTDQGIGSYPNDSCYLKKLDDSGNLVWNYNLDCNWVGFNLDDSGLNQDSTGNIYVGTNAYSGEYYIKSVDKDGNLNWEYNISSYPTSQIAFSPNWNTVYIGTEIGYLYAFEI